MGLDPQQLVTIVLAVSAFLLVFSLWMAGLLIWAGQRSRADRTIDKRLGVDEGRREDRVIKLWHEGEVVTSTVQVSVRKRSFMHRVGNQCQRAGWSIPAGTFVLWLVSGCLFAALIVGVLTSNVLLGLATALAVAVCVRILMNFRIGRREARFEAQLCDAMELAARSLRAGHPLLGAFRLISEEMTEPVSATFGELCQRHEMGEGLAESIEHVAGESSSADMKMFATSIAIQMRTGGNLADLMTRLAAVIRERMRLNRRVRVITAQTQMSKNVLIILPFFTFFVLNLINPSYMGPLYTETAGRILLGIGCSGLAIGVFLINRMARLKY